MTMMDPIGAMTSLVRQLEKPWNPRVQVTPEYYDYVALPENEFFAGMDVVTKYILDTQHCFNSPTFLDVGCGMGTKMFLAQRLGYSVHGIDIHQEYLDSARTLVNGSYPELCNAFDYEYYDQFDVVYAYHPCIFHKLQHSLNELIASKMRPGALFFLAGTKLDTHKNVEDQVWLIE